MLVTQYNRVDLRERPKSVTGDRTMPKYKPVYNSDGVYNLEQDGVYNTYDDIQSHKGSCDLSMIIERYNMTGDDSLLNARNGVYLDVTDYPKDYAELNNILIQANQDFQALPLEIREKFGQDPARFYAMAGSEEWAELVGLRSDMVVDEDIDKKGGPENVEKSE